MLDYIICSVFWIGFVFLLTSLGRVFNKGEKSLSTDLVTGYIVYSLAVAVVGIILQLLDVPWIIFAIYLGAVWLIILLVVVCSVKKNASYFLSIQWKEYFKDNWMLYAVCIVLGVALCCGYVGFWLGNHQDDGYYITKVATLPLGTIGGNMNYTLGIDQAGFTSYIVNTWEVEASVYVKILGVESTLFLRLFQSAFYYFLLVNLVKAFAEKLACATKLKISRRLPQFATVIVLLFGMYYIFLSDTYLFRLRDMFHFNSGMFLGISVVKMMGVMLLLLFYMDQEKISAKMVAGVIGISIVLMSKSTVALPIIMVISFSALFVWLFFEYGMMGKIVSCVLLFGYVICGMLLSDNLTIQDKVWEDMEGAIRSPILWVCLIIFVFSFFTKNRVIIKLNVFLVLCFLTMLLPEINDTFEHFAIYDFVGGRSLTTLLYFFTVLNFIYLIFLLAQSKIKETVVTSICISVAICEIGAMVWGFKEYGGGVFPDNEKKETSIRQCLSVIKNNIYFMPDSTIELGEKLNALSQECDERLRVVTPELVVMDGALHSLPVMLRIYAPEIIPVSAAERFPVQDSSALSDYHQLTYDAFVTSPSDETAMAFSDEIDELNVRCVVVQNEACGDWMIKMGYRLYDKVEEGPYFIWYKG